MLRDELVKDKYKAREEIKKSGLSHYTDEEYAELLAELDALGQDSSGSSGASPATTSHDSATSEASNSSGAASTSGASVNGGQDE